MYEGACIQYKMSALQKRKFDRSILVVISYMYLVPKVQEFLTWQAKASRSEMAYGLSKGE